MRATICKGILAAGMAAFCAGALADGSPYDAPSDPPQRAAKDPTTVGPYSDKYMAKAMPKSVVRTMPLSLALDEIVPTDAKWIILLDDRLQSRDVQIFETEGDWRERLRTMVEGNRLALLVDDRDKVITVASTREEASVMAQARINQPKDLDSDVAMDTTPGLIGSEAAVGAKGEEGGSGSAPFATWPTTAKQITRDELLNEEVGLNVRGITLRQLLVKLFPADWKIDLQLHRDTSEAMVDFTFEGPRGRALEYIHKTFKVDVLPYPRLAVVVVKGSES